MIIATLKYRKQTLFIEFLNPKKGKDFSFSCFHRKKNKRIPVGILEYSLKSTKRNAVPIEIYVDNMDVYPPFQRKGYGRILLNFCKGIAQASNLRIRLYSLSDVVGFYKRCGFKSEEEDCQDMVWKPRRRKKNVNIKTKKSSFKRTNKKASH